MFGARWRGQLQVLRWNRRLETNSGLLLAWLGLSNGRFSTIFLDSWGDSHWGRLNSWNSQRHLLAFVQLFRTAQHHQAFELLHLRSPEDSSRVSHANRLSKVLTAESQPVLAAVDRDLLFSILTYARCALICSPWAFAHVLLSSFFSSPDLFHDSRWKLHKSVCCTPMLYS